MYCIRIPGLISVFAILLSLSAAAQEKNRDDSPKRDSISVPSQDSIVVADSLKTHPKKTYVGIAFSYVNDNIYQGRKDSLAVPYFTPKIGYYHKSGLFIEAALGVNASSNNSGIDLFSFDGGYSFTAGNYEGELTATKLSYNSNSANVKSEMTGSVEYLNAFDLGFIKPTVQGAINFGTKSDYAASFGLEHSFYTASDKLEITPTAIANASTQNYYNSYYKVRKYNPKRKAKLLPAGVASISGEVLNAAAFKVLDYELSLPIHFESGKFTIGLIPVYAIPVHPSQVILTTTLNNGTVKTKTITEKISNNFFGSLELLIKL